jgi:hypothetical protein
MKLLTCKVVVDISCYTHSLALSDTGALFMWGQ